MKSLTTTFFLKNGDEESGNSLLWSYLNLHFKYYVSHIIEKQYFLREIHLF